MKESTPRRPASMIAALAILSVLLIFLAFAAVRAADLWTLLGGANPVQVQTIGNKLAVDRNGVVYLLFADIEAEQRLTVWKFDGSWTRVGAQGFTPGPAYPDGIAIDPENRPVIAYREAEGENRLRVMRYDGSAWGMVGSAPVSGSGVMSGISSLAIGTDGAIHVCYPDDDGVNWQNSWITVRTFDGANWIPVGAEKLPLSDGSTHGSIDIGPDGKPVVGFLNAEGYATVVKYDGSTWKAVGSAGFSPYRGTNPQLKLHPGGSPYFFYEDMENIQRATVMRYTGSAWVHVGNTHITSNGVNQGCFAMAPDGTPILGFGDKSHSTRGTVLAYVDGSWTALGGAGFTDEKVGTNALAIGANGIPYFTFVSYDVSAFKPFVMQYTGTPFAAAVTPTAGATATPTSPPTQPPTQAPSASPTPPVTGAATPTEGVTEPPSATDPPTESPTATIAPTEGLTPAPTESASPTPGLSPTPAPADKPGGRPWWVWIVIAAVAVGLTVFGVLVFRTRKWKKQD